MEPLDHEGAFLLTEVPEWYLPRLMRGEELSATRVPARCQDVPHFLLPLDGAVDCDRLPSEGVPQLEVVVLVAYQQLRVWGVGVCVVGGSVRVIVRVCMGSGSVIKVCVKASKSHSTRVQRAYL